MILPPLLLVQPSVIPSGGDALGAQVLAEAFHGGTGGAVDDATLVLPLLDEPEQDRRLLLGAAHVKEQVGSVESGHNAQRLPQLQSPHDVLLHLPRSGGGEGRHHRMPWQALDEGGDAQVAGTEILPPLGDTVGFIHRHEGHRNFRHESGKLRRIQSLRRHIQKLVRPRSGTLVHQLHLLDGEGAVQIGGLDACLAERGYLVFHQGDEGGDDQGDAVEHQGGDLVAQGLPAAGGHDAQHVPARQDGVNERLLPLPELAVTKVVFQRLVLIHLRFLPPLQTTISIPMIHGSGKKRKYPPFQTAKNGSES